MAHAINPAVSTYHAVCEQIGPFTRHCAKVALSALNSTVQQPLLKAFHAAQERAALLSAGMHETWRAELNKCGCLDESRMLGAPPPPPSSAWLW